MDVGDGDPDDGYYKYCYCVPSTAAATTLGITTQGCLSMMVSMLSCRYSPIVFKILARLSPKN
jgi:hypothetical protein